MQKFIHQCFSRAVLYIIMRGLHLKILIFFCYTVLYLEVLLHARVQISTSVLSRSDIIFCTGLTNHL